MRRTDDLTIADCTVLIDALPAWESAQRRTARHRDAAERERDSETAALIKAKLILKRRALQDAPIAGRPGE